MLRPYHALHQLFSCTSHSRAYGTSIILISQLLHNPLVQVNYCYCLTLFTSYHVRHPMRQLMGSAALAPSLPVINMNGFRLLSHHDMTNQFTTPVLKFIQRLVNGVTEIQF
jgi:hypothetical protein